MDSTTAVDLTNLYSRQEDIENIKHMPDCVCVVGVGGVGFWVAVNLAMIGVKEIHLVDNDLLGVVNLNRIPAPKEYVGRPKVEFAKKFIKLFRPNCEVIAYASIWNDDVKSYIKNDYALYECTDDFNTQVSIEKSVRKEVENYGMCYGVWHIHYDGVKNFTVENFLETEKEWGEVQNRYAVVNSMCPSAMIAGGLGVYYSLVNHATNKHFNKSIII
jgi:predicted ThiF/HesA family dinucleotide-utilizing enzyme